MVLLVPVCSLVPARLCQTQAPSAPSLLTSSWLLLSTLWQTRLVRWLPTFPSPAPSPSLRLVLSLPALLLPLAGCTGFPGPLRLLLSCRLSARSLSSGPAPSLLLPGLASFLSFSQRLTFSLSGSTVRLSSGPPLSRSLPLWAGSSTPCAWSAGLARPARLASATGATRVLGALVF